MSSVYLPFFNKKWLVSGLYMYTVDLLLGCHVHKGNQLRHIYTPNLNLKLFSNDIHN